MDIDNRKIEVELKSILNSISNENFALLNLNDFDYSLFRGLSGNILFYYNLYLLSKNESHLGYVKYFIDVCFKKIECVKYVDYSFSGGISGFFWVLNYIKQQNLIKLEDIDSLLDRIDTNINTIILKDLKQFDYDPFNGLIGYANYLLDRKTQKAEETLSLIVDILWENKYTKNDEFSWLVKKNSFNNSNSIKFNLGLAHGVPSIVMALSVIYKRGINTTRCYNMIIKSISWLESISIKFKKNHKSKFIYPSSIKEDNTFHGMGRFSWCYSDLGISLFFYNVGLNLKNDDLVNNGYLITRNLLSSINNVQIVNLVDDAGFCHGAYGNAHMFYKLSKAYGDKELFAVSKKFFELGISMKVNKLGFGGYQSLQYDNVTSKKYLYDDIGLLTGTSGIGLVILSFLHPEIEPTWDRCFLLS